MKKPRSIQPAKSRKQSSSPNYRPAEVKRLESKGQLIDEIDCCPGVYKWLYRVGRDYYAVDQICLLDGKPTDGQDPEELLPPELSGWPLTDKAEKERRRRLTYKVEVNKLRKVEALCWCITYRMPEPFCSEMLKLIAKTPAR